MKIAIHQPQYMPWVGYFHKMASADLFVFLDDVQFKKNEWIHRNRIRNSQGWQWLSVPNHYHFPQLIGEVILGSEKSWQEQHVKSITTCYGKAPFFGKYIDGLKNYYCESHKTIDTLNIASSRLLAEQIGITTPTVISSTLGITSSSTERLIDICKRLGADTYLAGAGGHDYMDITLFDKAGIKLEFQEFAPPIYKQHWCKTNEDFIPGLSVLDLLFNCGPDSLWVLMGIGGRR